MPKRVVLVGHCGPDSSYLRMTVAKAGPDVQVLSADDSDALKRVLDGGADLLLLNRQLDFGFDEEEGVALIRKLRAKYPRIKTMLVSNYPDAQIAAVQAGALPGFGKRELGTPRVLQIVRAALDEEARMIHEPRRYLPYLSVALTCLSLLFAPRASLADDAIVTIQWNKPDTALASAPLDQSTLDKVYDTFGGARNQTCNTAAGGDYAQNFRDTQRILKQLKAGDVLILNVHSSVQKVGASDAAGNSLDEALAWNKLWEFYGVKDPPRLGLVVLKGCMSHKEGKTVRDAAPDELEQVRNALNTEALVSPDKNIYHDRGVQELEELVAAMKNGDAPLAADGRLDPSGKAFRMTVTSELPKGSATLNELRKRARTPKPKPEGEVKEEVPNTALNAVVALTIKSTTPDGKTRKKVVHQRLGLAKEEDLTAAEEELIKKFKSQYGNADVVLRLIDPPDKNHHDLPKDTETIE